MNPCNLVARLISNIKSTRILLTYVLSIGEEDGVRFYAARIAHDFNRAAAIVAQSI